MVMFLVVPMFLALGTHQIGVFPIIVSIWFRWFKELLALCGIAHVLLASNYNFFVLEQAIRLHNMSSNVQVRYKINPEEDN
jgi:hypothetical protein